MALSFTYFFGFPLVPFCLKFRNSLRLIHEDEARGKMIAMEQRFIIRFIHVDSPVFYRFGRAG